LGGEGGPEKRPIKMKRCHCERSDAIQPPLIDWLAFDLGKVNGLVAALLAMTRRSRGGQFWRLIRFPRESLGEKASGTLAVPGRRRTAGVPPARRDRPEIV
jgi:hypothetical protein